MLEFIESIPVTVGLVVLIVPLLFRVVRDGIRRSYRSFCHFFTIPESIRQVAMDVIAVKYQVQTNDGGSLKDSVVRIENAVKKLSLGQLRLESYRQHDFWRQPRPGLEMDEFGRVNLASEAACRLFRVSDPEQLLNHSWSRFLDGDHVHAFMQSFREIAESNSIFRFSIALRAEDGTPRGEWEFKANPIDSANPKLYSGFFSPVDDVAREVARKSHWHL